MSSTLWMQWVDKFHITFFSKCILKDQFIFVFKKHLPQKVEQQLLRQRQHWVQLQLHLRHEDMQYLAFVQVNQQKNIFI